MNAIPAAPHPTVRFHRLIDQARLPVRADRSALGTLPMRAARYCDAVCAASAFGWYVFPPMDLSLSFDGEAVFWTHGGLEDWLPLEAALFPDFAARFDAAAPEAARGCAPPFLTALPEPGVVQVWTGLIARTAPDWSLLIRPVANLPPGPGAGFVPYEGIVETDRWFGPLFVNIRLTRTHSEIRLRAGYPMAQAQALPRSVYADAVLDAADTVDAIEGMGPADWADFHDTVVVPNTDPDRPVGQYAVRTRKRRKGECPYAAAARNAG